jgi:predicted dehydrogenase
MIKIGIIGYGYWGPNLVRNFSLNDNCSVKSVSDKRVVRLNVLKKLYPNIEILTDADDIIADNEIDAVIIATPVFTHFELALKALKSGKHVLLEKPMTATVKEAAELIEVAENMGLVLMVDHTFLYTGAVQKIKSIIDNGHIGEMKYFDSTRINLGLFQQDINVLWDLAPHDLSILLYLIKEKPVSVNATGISHTKNGLENIGFLTINFDSDLIAHFNCSWTSPVKVRQTLIGGDKKMIVYNDLEPSEKLRIYDTGYDINLIDDKSKIMVDYRTGDVFIPKLKSHEALSAVATDFINSILYNTKPVSENIIGLDVVKILEAAQLSIKQNGSLIEIY